MSGFFARPALHMDDELRKLVEQLVGLRAWAAQEETGRGTEKKSTQQEIYKKIYSSATISRRPPYAKST